MKIYVYGAGKAGRALHRAWRTSAAHATLRARRRGFPKRTPQADLVVLAVRDDQLADVAATLAGRGLEAVVHCAGALGAEVLHPLRAGGTAIGQMHPLVSLADGGSVAGAHACVTGDATAARLARRAAKHAGMHPFTPKALDRALYHACAALLANGGAALAAAAADGMARAGCEPSQTPAMLGALLISVGRNLQQLGVPAVLTGPVRRGDAQAIQSHLDALKRSAPELRSLYGALARAQLPLARALAEARAEDFDAIERILRKRA